MIWKFDMVDGDAWVTGTFDRVVIRQQDGVPCGATIIDFKSNEVPDDDAITHLTQHYRPQLELYRKVLAKLCGLEERQIELKLIFTRIGRVATL